MGLLTAVSACVSPDARPLPTKLSTHAALSQLDHDPARLPDMPLTKHRIDLSQGLDPTSVAILAVLNSPNLKARRAADRVAAAQVFAAGLLPDPQVNLSLDIPIPGQFVGPGQAASTAYGVVPNLDLIALITHSAALKAARAGQRQTDLDLLWAEWGVAQQARGLAETVVANEAKAKTLADFASLAQTQATQSGRALARGDVAGEVADADLALKIDAQTQAGLASNVAQRARLNLNVLIGLEPQVNLPLVAGDRADWDQATIAKARAKLTARRPDLMALRAGYNAQEANLRKAVLAQFPLLNLGLNHAMDNTGILSNGPTATLTLPIFRTARGPIAIEAATHDQLRAEYQARLDQTDSEVAADLTQRTSDEAQTRLLTTEIPELERLDVSARNAWRRGDLDAPSYIALAQTYLTKASDLEDRRLASRLAEVSLEAALFLPPAAAPSNPGEIRP